METEFQKIWKAKYNSQSFQKNLIESFSKPYPTLGSLPDAVRKLPKHAQEIFQSAFNSSYKNPPSGRKPEEYAFRVAWSAIKNAGYEVGKSIDNEKDGIKCLKSAVVLLEEIAKMFSKYGGHYDTYENGNYGGADSSMKERKKIKVEKSFNFLIEKAFPVDINGNLVEVGYRNFDKEAIIGDIDLNSMFLEGIATTTNVDHDLERMSQDAINAMLEKINEKGVPLMSEHQKTWDAKLGDVIKAWADERGQLHIKAKLDKDSSRAVDLYKALKKGLQVGLSVAGTVKRSAQEFVEGLGKKIKTFYDVALKEISVTNRPSNFDTWCIAKHQTAGSLEGHLFGKPHPFYEEYLQNYPSLNWQLEFAKSVAEVSKESMPEEIKKQEEEKVDEEKVEEEKIEEKRVENDPMAKMSEKISELTTEIRNLLKHYEEKGKETSVAGETKTETSDTETKETTEETTKPCKGAKKQVTIKPVGTKETPTETETESEGVDSSSESETETEITEDEKKKDANEIISNKAISKSIAEEIEKRFRSEGKRLIGPLQETIEKLMTMPLKRKGIASEGVYKIEKKFAGNPDEEGKVEEGGESEFQKDLKDEKLTFKDVFKKHLSSFK